MSKKATARINLPVRVTWKCPSCGADNTCTHSIAFSGISQKTFASDDKLKELAREDLKKAIDKQFDRFREGKFQQAKLNSLSCSSCGNKPVWTTYSEIPSWVIFLMLAGFIGLFVDFILFDMNNVIVTCASLVLVILPILIASIVVGIKNRAVNRQAAELPEESRPHIQPLR